jgi:hypothetical protein
LESVIKTILLIIGGIFIFFLLIIFLPILILLYLILPKRSSRTWFNTFTQQARSNGFRQGKSQSRSNQEETESYSNEIPASQDVIDVTAEEVKDKESK